MGRSTNAPVILISMHRKIASVFAVIASLQGICALAQAPGRGPVGGACNDAACDIQRDWVRNNGMFYLVANAMPAEKYGYKPTPAQQSFAERVLHVADINVGMMQTLGGKTPPPQINMKATTKAEAMKELQKANAYGAALMKEFTQAQLMERVPSPEFMGPTSSRQELAYFVMTHIQDTYGQLVVYLRLNGITPPLSVQP